MSFNICAAVSLTTLITGFCAGLWLANLQHDKEAAEYEAEHQKQIADLQSEIVRQNERAIQETNRITDEYHAALNRVHADYTARIAELQRVQLSDSAGGKGDKSAPCACPVRADPTGGTKPHAAAARGVAAAVLRIGRDCDLLAEKHNALINLFKAQQAAIINARSEAGK